MDKDFEQIIKKIDKMRKAEDFDLSGEEDLSIAIMNLVSLEEHFFFTASKTEKPEYFKFMEEIREVRKKMLGRMVKKHEGETWCITKHLLAATMRLIEVGTKLQSEGKKKEAEETFEQAYKIYSIFWAVRLKLIDLSGLEKISDDQLNVHDKEKKNKPWTFRDIVNKLVDCCDE